MRTTITIDDEVFTFAKAQARRQRILVGEIVSRLARDGIGAQNALATPARPLKDRLALLPARAEIVTTEYVRELMGREGF